MEQPTILVVEDNAVTRKMMRVALSGAGYRVVEAEDGAAALARVRERMPELVLQDLLLPDVHGVELAGRIRLLPGGRDLPILAVSGVASQLDQAETLRAGFSDYLFKPVGTAQLLEAVARHLRPRGGAGEAAGGGRRVLVVDDDPVQRKLQRVRLEQMGFRVETAGDGAEALERVRADPPAAVLCDMLMPRMSGLDFCVALRADPLFDRVPVVLASAVLSDMDDEDRELAARAGASALVQRTPGLDEAAAALLAALDPGSPARPPAAASEEVRHAWTERLVRQLERQAALTASLARRSAIETAQVSIMSGAAEVLASTTDLKLALDEVLRRALDAGGLSAGAIFLLEPGGGLALVSHLGFGSPPNGALMRLLSAAGLLAPGADRRGPVRIPVGDVAAPPEAEVLERMGVRSAIAAPLVSGREPQGVLLMSSSANLLGPEWIAAIRAIAGQLAQAVALARALGRLADSEQRFRGLVEGMPVGLYRSDAHGTVVDANPMLVSMLGYRSHRDLLAAGVAVMGEGPGDREHWAAATAGPEPTASLEMRVRRADGGLMWVENTVRPVRDRAGDVVFFEGALVDATERRRAEDELRAARDRLGKVLGASSAVIFALRPDGDALRPVWVSENLTRVFGYRVEEALEPGWWLSRVHPADREQVAVDVRELLAESQLAREYRFRHANGTYRWILDERRLLTDEAAGTREVVSAWVDVTERKTLQQELVQAQKMESVGQLAGGIAHDFNNMLTVIIADADMLLADMTAADPRREELQEIRDAGQRSAALTRQLLAFSRRQVMQPRVLSLNEVIAGMDRMLHRIIGEDLVLAYELDPALGQVRADPGQLEQVLLNLIVNARDAMPHGGRLTVATANLGPEEAALAGLDAAGGRPYAMLSVADTGVGMDAETRAHLFEPFFTTKETGKGTGLGLATVYGIVKQSEGGISVTSEPGRGATFRVFLPLVDPAARVPGEEGGPAAPPRGMETVLLVEDEAMVRRVTRGMLERLGYSVLEAAGPAEALEKYLPSGARIDLLLTDVVMPGMSGAELAALFRADKPAMRVLYASGYPGEMVAQHASLAAGIPFVAKPFTEAALARTVREVLDGPPNPAAPARTRIEPR
jgi:two-component system cell cycle sensor histidine kinase/response regulator CckA